MRRLWESVGLLIAVLVLCAGAPAWATSFIGGGGGGGGGGTSAPPAGLLVTQSGIVEDGKTAFDGSTPAAWGQTIATDSRFLTDGNFNLPLISLSGGYAQFTRDFLGGFSNWTGFAVGSAANQASCEEITSGQGGGSLDNVQAGLGACP